MKTALLFICCFMYAVGLSQPSDFIILKKGQHTLKNFFAGISIGFKTDKGSYSGKITSVNKDSLFINQYDVRRMQSNLGVYFLDTVATYRLSFNYRDITGVEKPEKKGFSWAASGGSLLGGGLLLTTFGLGTWVFTKPGTQYHASTGLVVGSAALAGIGYLLLRSNVSYYGIGNKYQLQYIKVK